MKPTFLKPFLWLTVFVGCSGLLTGTPQPVSGQTNSPVLLVQQSDELEEAGQLEQQALQLYQQGKYNEAIPLAERILEIRERLLGENHPDVGYSLNNLAELYRNQGRYYQAEPLYKRSLAILEKALGKDHPSVATSLNNLAGLYRSQGRYEEAEPLYKQSLEMRKKLLGQEHPSVADSLNNLATLYRSQGRYEEAEPLFLQSLEMRKKLLGQEHPSVADSLNDLAGLYESQGRYGEAELLYKQALEMRKKLLGQDHPHVATSLISLTLLYSSQGRYGEAINFLSKGLDVQEQNLNILLATGSERQKQDSMKTLLGTTYQAISLHIQNAPDNSEAARLALTTLLRRKGRILDVVTNDLQLLRENITPENQQLLDELQSVRTQLATLIYKQPDPSATLRVRNLPLEQYHQQVATLREEAEQLEAELSRRSAEFREISEPVTIEAVQQLIPEDAALVELVLYKPFDAKANRWGKPHYAAYILKSSGEPQWIETSTPFDPAQGKPLSLNLGEAEPIHKAYFKRRGFGWNLVVKASPALMKKSARSLDELLMQPIREKLGDINHIIISPDAQLNKISFAALVDENNRYLIENHQITYLTTGRDLIRLQNEYPHRQNPVIVANPNYDNPGQPTTVPVANNRGTNQLSRSVDPSTSLRANMSFGALPGTAEEARVISDLLPNVTVFTESEATENSVKQVEAPEILHIATHGFFLKNLPRVEPDNSFGLLSTQSEAEGSTNSRPSTPIQENPLLRSGLAMAGFNPRESGSEDGVLTALEVANLKLRGTKLVVLSACETGLGEIENGEGVYGLRRAFTLAGAESQP